MSDLHQNIALLSLDDYIKKSNLLLDCRKKNKPNIDKDKLDAGLDKIARKNAMKRNQRSKFDRFNDDENSSESDDEEEAICKRTDSDVQMLDMSDQQQKDLESENSSIRFAKEIQQMEHPKCCQIKKHFTTIESEQGIKIQSQQWRIDEQKKGTRWDERSVRPIRNGRVGKIYKKTAQQQPKTGLFVEKGSFTYKFADVNGNSAEENAESIIGIVRNKPKFVNGNNYRAQRGDQPININVNLNGFAREMHTNCIETLAPPPIPRRVNYIDTGDDLDVNIAAEEFFKYLKNKRDKASQPTNGLNMSVKQNEYVVNASAGEGIENMNFVPNATNLPLNLRFA